MAIGTVVTRGFATGATIALVALRGYVGGAAVGGAAVGHLLAELSIQPSLSGSLSIQASLLGRLSIN